MTALLVRICFLIGLPAAGILEANTISWFCIPNKPNLTSAGAAMDAGFEFQLGVFTGAFVPTVSNQGEWASRWVPAQTSAYNPASKSFGGNFAVSGNAAPFTVGKKAYVWGRKTTSTASEWILFSETGWTWPAPDSMNPFPIEWNASAAVAIIGQIDPSVGNFLMKSESVSSYTQWSNLHLAGELLQGPNADPDYDGSPNLLEFIFGTLPLQAGAPTATPTAFVDISGQKYLQITVPRLRNRLAEVTVEVSGNLVNWNSGGTHLVEISNTSEVLVVRDLTPSGPGLPKRFMRARAVTQP